MPECDLKVRKRIYRTQLGAYLLIIVIGIVGFWQIGQQQRSIVAGQAAACQAANDSRAGQRKIWAFFFQVSEASAKAQHQPKAVLDFYDEYLQWINEQVLPPRNCSDLDKVYPDPGPPPSFEEALKEAAQSETGNPGNG